MSGCGEDFAPPHKLTKTRILAIKAEPPNPAFGESTTLQPLFYMKEGEEITRIRWSFCPVQGIASDGYSCFVDQTKWDALWAGFGMETAPTLDLGEGETGTFTNPFPPELLDALCSNRLGAGQNELVFNCTVGYPVQIRMVATTTKGELTAISELYLPIDANAVANQNPIVGPVRIVRPISETTLDDEGAITVPRNVELHMELEMEESVSEHYPMRLKNTKSEYLKDASGNYLFEEKQESINAAWYAEDGDFGEGDNDSSRSGYTPGSKDANGNLIPFSLVREMVWRAPKVLDNPKSEMRVIVVLRDNRGGINWQMVRVGLEATP
jgi:hypothetical protein